MPCSSSSLVFASALLLTAVAHAEAAPPALAHAEIDPLPFALGGYGGQIGLRHPVLRGVRLAVASFALDVPDAFEGDNAGWDKRVRPSAALYALYYTAAPGHDGWALGASLRYLRPRYINLDVDGDVPAGEPLPHADVEELSPELIVGYQWHPWGGVFYVQPWAALAITAWRRGEPRVDGWVYDEPAVSPFFTVNLGWELGL